MTNQNSTDFAELTVSFLTDYMPLQRGLSNNTILSYRDTFKLLLRFIANDKSLDLKKFSLKELDRNLILEFLSSYRNKGASSRTANQRLAAIKAFCEYVSTEVPDCLNQLLGIRNIKSKRSPGRQIQFLTVEQTTLLVNLPDIRSRTGLRHRVILTLLYDSGCRVQELCDLTVGDVFVCDAVSTVKLHGKGNKTRTVFISQATAKLLSLYKEKFHRHSLVDEPFIKGRYGGKIKRNGVAYVLDKYGKEATLKDPTFPAHIHCHMLRHSKAMHLLQAGVEITRIRDFMGHEDVSATMVYVKADNRLKEEVIGRLAPKVVKDAPKEDWTKDKDLMAFLDTLG
ncbi:MAG: site-specific integrase [Burkholderiales bacterium]|nr:site-specific integrase [Burkholderiales bacterium]